MRVSTFSQDVQIIIEFIENGDWSGSNSVLFFILTTSMLALFASLCMHYNF